jgi:hypothetical protein
MIMKTKMNDALAARSAREARPHDQMMRQIEALWNGQGRGEEARHERASCAIFTQLINIFDEMG